MSDHCTVFGYLIQRAQRPRLLFRWAMVLACLTGIAGHARGQQLQARLYDEIDGLANLSATSFAQQADGHLWIGTINGVFRYDGSVFTEFGRSAGLTDPSVFSLLLDRTGTLWAGSHGGLFWFDGRLFHEVRYGQKSLRVGVNSMLAATRQGELVVETSSGIFSVERDSATGAWAALRYRERHPSFPNTEDTDGIAVDNTGLLWFGCTGKLCSYNGNAVRTFGPAQGVPQDFYVSLFVARDGQMWARGRGHILSWRPDPAPTHEAVIRDLTAGFPAGAIVTVNRRFAEDGWGRILTPTAHGFATWDGRAWTETQATSAGAIEGATDLFADRENSIWIGTDGAGVLHSRGYGLWQDYGTAEGLANAAVGAIAQDRAGRIWIGHNLGAGILFPSAQTVSHSALDGKKDSAFVSSFASEPDGGIWAATVVGHVFHVNAAGRVDRHDLLDAYIRQIRLDTQGTLWIATNTGLYTLRGRGQPKLFHFASGRPTPIDDMVFAPDGSMWFAGNRGLGHLRGNQATIVPVPSQPSGLKLLFLNPDGTLWVSGRSPGLLHIQVDDPSGAVAEPKIHVLESYLRPQLASDLIEFLGADSKGRLWIGTDHGVNVLSSGKVFHLTEEDGLMRDDAGGNAFLAQPDGSVWIGTGKGVSHLTNPEAALQRQPFSVVIEDAEYRGKPLIGDSAIGWTRGTPTFRYSAITFRNNRKLAFHSQLLGFDPAETVGKDLKASYPQLAPGSYTFRVYAQDTGNGAVSAPVEFRFTLTPPWWRTGWARMLAVTLFFALIAALWYTLHLALLAQRRKLQRMVHERTQELEKLANHDALTGLLNRRALFAALVDELENAYRHHAELCVAIIDLDHFKRVNDIYGHQAGDEVLRQAAKRLTGIARSADGRASDIVGRYGGEEFLVIFKDAKYTMGIERCESIRSAMSAQPMRFGNHELTVTCSIGVAWIHRTPEPVAKLLADADKALYSAKNLGRDQVVCANEDFRLANS